MTAIYIFLSCVFLYGHLAITVDAYNFYYSYSPRQYGDSRTPRRCTLPLDPGPCRGSFERYYYNSDTDSCEQFVYGGCRGNANNFMTKAECLISCTNLPRQCTLDPQPGPIVCFAYIPSYFYNTETEQCERFIYGGCGGTANIFPTKEACTRVCSPNCYSRPDPGPCYAAFPRWFYNPITNDCEEFIYGGCQGNDNNFESRDACLGQCGDICKQDRKVGPCRAAIPRFYYDRNSQTCERFSWGGCQPNSNNFETEGACLEVCGPGLDQGDR